MYFHTNVKCVAVLSKASERVSNVKETKDMWCTAAIPKQGYFCSHLGVER